MNDITPWRIVEPGCVDALWNQVCQQCESATFFHTKTWADVITRTFPQWVPEPLVREFSDGNIVVLPLMRRKGIVRHYYESMPPGLYGGPLFSEPPSQFQTQTTLDALNEFSSIIICGNPFSSALSFPVARRRELHTHVLDLRAGGDRIEKGFRKGHRANIAAASRKGVRITLASNLGEVNSYFDVYCNSIARWGQNASGFYPKRLFHNLFQLAEYRQKVKLWLAKYDGRVIAGAWVFYHGGHVVYWHGAMHADYMHCHPVHLMLSEAIKAACEEGFRWFDFNPSGGLQGVEHFKRGFGAEVRAFAGYRRLGPIGKAYRAKRHFQETLLRTCSV